MGYSRQGLIRREYRSVEAFCRLLPDHSQKAKAMIEELNSVASVEALRLNGLLSLAYSTLLPADGPLMVHGRRALHESLVLEAETKDLLRALTLEGIEAISLKGAVLSARIYPRTTDRHSGDIDLLVRPSDFAAARRVFEGLGYRSAALDESRHEHGYALALERGQSFPVELHDSLFHGEGSSFDCQALFERSEPFTFGSISTRVLSSEDEFCYLAVHAAGHRFQKLLWLLDLKYFIDSKALDWDKATERARALGRKRMFLLATRVLEARLSLEGRPRPTFPEKALLSLTPYYGSKVLAAQPIGGRFFSLLAADSLTARARLLRRRFC